VSTFADPGAHVTDTDIDRNEPGEDKFRRLMSESQEYTSFAGEDVEEETIAALSAALNGTFADVIFMELRHIYSQMMREFELYL